MFVALVMLAAGSSAQGPRRLLVISIDGMMPDAYLAPGSAAPNLRRLAARGAWASGVGGVWPTNTRPSHTTLISGVAPDVHGIVDNYVLDPEQTRDATYNWFAKDIRVPTLPTALRSAGRSTAVIMWPISVGLDATFVVPTFNWQSRPEDLTLLRSLSTPRLLEDFERALGRQFAWPPTDTQRAGLATFIARNHRPDAMFLYFGTLDAYQHTYGPKAPMTASSLKELDLLVGVMLASLESEGLLNDTYVAIVSDHGYIDVEHAVSPNAAFREAGLIRINDAGKIAAWDAYSHGEGGSSLVYLRNDGQRDKVRGILETLKADSRSGIARILDTDALRTAQADPAAAFGLEMKPGYSLSQESGRVYGPPYIHAMHGYPPTTPEMRASFILTGPGMAGTGDLGIIRMTQIAPTLARLLGVSLSPKADKPIEKIFGPR